MEDITITGIVLNSMKYKEKDRLIHIFSVELGNITAILKGVDTPSSKLKFASQLFCFAKFDLTEGHGFYVVKSVELIDSFFDLSLDYETFSLANSMLEICNFILKPDIIAENLFLILLKTLQNIVYNSISPWVAVLKFYVDTLDMVGYRLNFDRCDACGMPFVGDIRFNVESGTFRCVNCSGGERVDKRIFVNLKIIFSTSVDRLHTLKIPDATARACLRLVMEDISSRTGCRIKSVDYRVL